MARSDHKRAARDPITAQLWNSLVERLPEERFGSTADPTSLNRVLAEVRNTTGTAINIGEVYEVNSYDGPADPLNPAEGLYTLIDPIWHSRISSLVVAAEPIPAGEEGLAVISGHAVARITNVPGRQFAQIDPFNRYRFKAATGGPVKVMAQLDSLHALVVVGYGQNLWKYETTAELGAGAGTVQADLKELNGTFYGVVTLTFPPGRIDCALPSGTEGLCMQAGNEFWALNTSSAYYGKGKDKQLPTGPMTPTCDEENTRLCFEQEVVNAKVFTCDEEPGEGEEPPKIQVFCLDQSLFDCLDLCQWICENCDGYVVVDLECKDPPPCCGDCQFPDTDAITGLSVTDGVDTFTQNGPSSRESDCCFAVPMDNGETASVCYDGASNWSVKMPSTSTMEGTGPCSGAVSVADASQPSIWSGGFTSNGEACEEPPPECCCDCLFNSPYITGLTITGPDAGGGTVTQNGPAVRIDECTFEVPTDDGGTWTVTWLCVNQWQVGLEQMSGDCVGAFHVSNNGTEYRFTAQGEECGGRVCCDYTGDEYIKDFSAVSTDQIAIFQVGDNNAPLLAGIGDCNSYAQVPVRVEPAGGGNGCNVIATVTLRYDQDCNDGAGGCVWDVSIPQCNDPGLAHPGSFIASEGCTGIQSCSNPCGTCGTPVVWGSATFEVVDPDGPVACQAPPAPAMASLAKLSADPRERPGTRLRIKEPDMFAKSGCGCKDAAKLMDAWGCDRCENELDRLVSEVKRGCRKSTIAEVQRLDDDEIRQRILAAVIEERTAKRVD